MRCFPIVLALVASTLLACEQRLSPDAQRIYNEELAQGRAEKQDLHAETDPEPTRPRFTSAAIAAAKTAISAEPKVKDLLYREDRHDIEWQVGVLTDRTPRFGYAEYLCLVAKEHGAVDENTEVRVVDIAKVAAGDDFGSASLGTVRCADGTRLDDAPAARR